MLSVALIEDDHLVSNPYAALLRSEYPGTIQFDQIFTMGEAIAAVKKYFISNRPRGV